MLKNIMREQLKMIEQKLQDIEAELKILPENDIFVSKNGNYYKWFTKEDNKQIYIPKSERQYAEQLARRKYLLCYRKDLLNEKRGILSYLNACSRTYNHVETLFTKSPEYLNLLPNCFSNLSKELTQWANAPYPKNPNYSNNLLFETGTGQYVRSKSETIIYAALKMRNIPFRYECPLVLGSKVFYPDFTIRDPRTGMIYYFEHFGLIDEPGYQQNMFKKLQEYASHGIYLSINLIATFETKERPLDMAMVNRTLDLYFGPIK